MSDHPHISLGGTDTAWTWACRCGVTPTEYTAETARGPWGRDCTASMRDEITALRGQVEALKDGAGSLHKAYARGRDEERTAVVAFIRRWRDRLTSADIRGKFDRAATDVENGAHHRA